MSYRQDCLTEYQWDRLHTQENLSQEEGVLFREHIESCVHCQQKQAIRTQYMKGLREDASFQHIVELEKKRLERALQRQKLQANRETNLRAPKRTWWQQWFAPPVVAVAAVLLFFLLQPEQIQEFTPEYSGNTRPLAPKPVKVPGKRKVGPRARTLKKVAPMKRIAPKVRTIQKPVPKRQPKKIVPKRIVPGNPKSANVSVRMLHFQRGAVHSQWTQQGERLQPGDLIQFSYKASAPFHMMIVSLNKKGTLSVIEPLGKKKSLAMAAGNGDLPEDESLELDDELGAEWIFAVTSDKPFTLKQIQKELSRKVQKSGRSFPRFMNTKHLRWRTFLIFKQHHRPRLPR